MVYVRSAAEFMSPGLNPIKEAAGQRLLRASFICYGRSMLEVLLKIPKTAFVIKGLAEKTAGAAGTVDYTYSPVVCPDLHLERFFSLSFRAGNHLI